MSDRFRIRATEWYSSGEHPWESSLEDAKKEATELQIRWGHRFQYEVVPANTPILDGYHWSPEKLPPFDEAVERLVAFVATSPDAFKFQKEIESIRRRHGR